MALYDHLEFFATSDNFFLRPLGSSLVLCIDRVSQDLSLQEENGQCSGLASQTVYGIVGIVRLLAGPYLILISDRVLVGNIHHHAVWRVAGTIIVPFARSKTHLGEAQISDEQEYLSMVEAQLRCPYYYFSYTYDLTHTAQRIQGLASEPPPGTAGSRSLLQRARVDFVWNHHLLESDFGNRPELALFTLPLMHGFVSINWRNVINGIDFTFCLLSRRSTRRAGTRFNRRGIDERGHVANQIETEQLLFAKVGNGATVCGSFVQTRGSIPLYWTQKINIRYKPPIEIAEGEKHQLALRLHCSDHIGRYGDVVAINLIDNKGSEKQLADKFQDLVRAEQHRISYEHFDFHAECPRLKWDRLSILMDRVVEHQKRHGFFLAIIRPDGVAQKVEATQAGVFRTNCMDCLDRTNVVQSMLARRSLSWQLQRLGVLREGELVEEHGGFDALFRNVWADNADICSTQYAGTNAMKTDFTRDGKRTANGLLMDGYNALLRYTKNNFFDGFRQDSIDLLLGNHVVDPGEGVTTPSKFTSRPQRRLLLALVFGFAMFIISMLVPIDDWTVQLMYMGFWLVCILVTIKVVLMYGTDIVDRPRLCRDLGTGGV